MHLSGNDAIVMSMNVKAVGRLIGASSDTVRRWTSEYSEFLSTAAVPGFGRERKYSQHDIRVLAYISAARELGRSLDEIREELVGLQKGGWADLPPSPPEWNTPEQDGRIAVVDAREESQAIATVAAQQVIIQTLREQLQEAQDRAENLQRRVDNLETSSNTTQAEVSELRVQLAEARGQVETLKARLGAYHLGGDKPISPLALIGLVALVTVAVVILIALIMTVIT